MTKHTVVVLFYKYFIFDLSPPLKTKFKEEYTEKLREHQLQLCSRLQLRGRVLLSCEGINGTVSAKDSCALDAYISEMKAFDFIRDLGVDADADEASAFSSSKLYENIDWKTSTVDERTPEPFPDLKISIVNEIVSTGGALKVDEIPQFGGHHLSPREFHSTIQNNDNVVLIDVRNTFECSIGHFVNPHTGEAAINPQMVSFSAFDSTFCSRMAEELRDKKVLMYCTGGIRCEKASAMLRKRGVNDVSQLEGGIHRYMETFGAKEGFFKGKNFVFDQRVALDSNQSQSNDCATQIVGACVECSCPFEEISGSRLCTVCRDLVLVCPKCQTKLREYHCVRHAGWKRCYFTFLEVFSEDELVIQDQELAAIRENLVPAAEYKNMRRTLSRQIQKVRDQLDSIARGHCVPDKTASRRCRTCMETSDICDGHCFGFWKHRQVTLANVLDVEPLLPVAVGDRVGPGPHWNTLRLGVTVDSNGLNRQGTVVDIKPWASEGDKNDCVAVTWDDDSHNQKQEIYRWGFIARNGHRMYDVQKI
ncbi:hypothetical protein MHU86_501 [Fragilaria crotonensis]|nr:hypothetical protein MHU86_501 [Fragilaria crotonensis]